MAELPRQGLGHAIDELGIRVPIQHVQHVHSIRPQFFAYQSGIFARGEMIGQRDIMKGIRDDNVERRVGHARQSDAGIVMNHAHAAGIEKQFLNGGLGDQGIQLGIRIERGERPRQRIGTTAGEKHLQRPANACAFT
jgi:hypothetical protein